jgi:sugar-specific transcriptional regulator TrmB
VGAKCLSEVNLDETGEVDVFTSLGLSNRQARVYLALLKTGDAKAKIVAAYAQVERQEVYNLIEELHQRGLVEQNLTTPTSYTATPIDKAIALLIGQKSDELICLINKATKMVTKLTQTPNVCVGKKPCFGTIFEGSRGKQYIEAIQETRQSIDIVTSWTRFNQQNLQDEPLFYAKLKKRVNLRYIIEKPSKCSIPRWVEAAKEKYSNFEIRTQPNPPSVAVAIFDQKKAAIAYDAHANLNEGPDLWTTHHPLTVLCQTYFDVTWKQAQSS